MLFQLIQCDLSLLHLLNLTSGGGVLCAAAILASLQILVSISKRQAILLDRHCHDLPVAPQLLGGEFTVVTVCLFVCLMCVVMNCFCIEYINVYVVVYSMYYYVLYTVVFSSSEANWSDHPFCETARITMPLSDLGSAQARACDDRVWCRNRGIAYKRAYALSSYESYAPTYVALKTSNPLNQIEAPTPTRAPDKITSLDKCNINKLHYATSLLNSWGWGWGFLFHR